MSSREAELNSAACRLLLSMAPGLDTALVFQEKVGLEGPAGVGGARSDSLMTLPSVCCLLIGRPGGEAL